MKKEKIKTVNNPVFSKNKLKSEIEVSEFAESIINTVREPLLALDQDLRVVKASRSFYEFFMVAPDETIGTLIYDLGNQQWDIPKLRELLETILPEKSSFENYEVEHDFSSIGKHTMLLNARQIERAFGKEKVILLAIEDITARKRIEAGLDKTRKELAVIKISADEVSEFSENLIDTVREPLLVLDQDLRVVKASRSFYEFFKVTPDETIGTLIYDLGNHQWDIPKLRELLETILPEKTTFDNYEVEHDFATIGKRIMLLNARQIGRASGKEKVILLAIEDVTERKQSEELLTESEERYRRIFETANDGILLLDKSEFKIHYANASVTRMLDYSIEECIGKELKDIGFPENLNTLQETLMTLDKNGIVNYRNSVMHTKTGKFIDTDIYMVDKTNLIQCNIRDITERKQAEEELHESENKFRIIAENSPDAIFISDQQGKYVYTNLKASELFGFSQNEFLEINITDQWSEDKVDKYSKIIEKLIETGRISSELELRKKDGTFLPIEINAVILPNGLVYGSCRDITERKQAEEILRISQMKYKTLFDSSPLGITVADKNGKILESNKMAEKLLGLSQEEQEKRKISGEEWKIIRPDGTPMPSEEFASVRAQKEKRLVKNVEMGIVKADNKITWLIVAAIPLPLETHELVIAYSDITARLQAEKQIKRDLKEKTLLLQEIHHRTKNNLQTICSLMQMQESTIRTKEDALQGFKVTQDRIRAMAKAYEILLRSDYMSEIKLNDYITELADELARNYHVHRKVNIKYSMDDVLFDAEKLSKLGLIINEIITNSMKYAFKGRDEGNIHITLEDAKENIKIIISDDGLGIPESIKIPNTETLGLSLVDMLIGEFHGTYAVDRKNGTSFTLEIPKERIN